MGPVEITVIVLVSLFVVAMIAVMVARKLKGKPSLGSDCGCCPYSGKCDGACSHCGNTMSASGDDKSSEVDTSKE